MSALWLLAPMFLMNNNKLSGEQVAGSNQTGPVPGPPTPGTRDFQPLSSYLKQHSAET